MIITKKCRASETEKSRTEMPSSSYGSNQSASVDSLHSAASAHAPSGFMGLSKLLIARLAFIACLLAAAAALGWLAHHLLSTSEDKLGEKQFDYIAERALATAREKTGRQQQGARTFASIYANLFPDVAEWVSADDHSTMLNICAEP